MLDDIQVSVDIYLPSTMKLNDTVSSAQPSLAHLEDFDLLKLLGKGAYGKVYQVRKIRGCKKGKIFAMKAINKSNIISSKTDVRHTKSERDVLAQVDHPFIVKLYYAFETRQRVYLVQEFCHGGELFRRMEIERMLLEDHARFYLAEIVCALEFLHERNIIYRDLKTENVMLDMDGHVRLIDFGLSKMNMGPGVTTNTFCGTVEYMAPEVVSRADGYGKPSDWWSFGVFTFDLLTGRSPFYTNRGKAETKQRILTGKIVLPVYVTRCAQDLIRKLLRRPINRRLGSSQGAHEIKSHDFFSNIDWDDVLAKKLSPPFIPQLQSEMDVSNFDPRFTTKSPRESVVKEAKLTKQASADDSDTISPEVDTVETVGDQSPSEVLFRDFDFVSPEMTDLDAEDKILMLQDLRIRSYGSP